jgi:phytoene desaturase
MVTKIIVNQNHRAPLQVTFANMKIAIVGSGIAGLASAIRLRVGGHEVTVFEQNDYPGGKLSAFEQDGYRFDAGPSLFTLPNLVDELFVLAGKNPQDHFQYIRKNITCQYFWEDKTRLTAWADRNKFVAEAVEKTGVSEQAVKEHLDHSALLYETTNGIFIERSLHLWKNYFHKDVWKAFKNLGKLALNKTLNDVNQERLKNARLVQLFNRYATYNGSDPYKTPGVMLIIPHLEHHIGTFYPVGGMHQITMSLYNLALDLGVVFHFNSPVSEIRVEQNKVTGVVVRDEEWSFDAVVSNMDVVPTYRHLLKGQKSPEKILNQPRSSSALIFYWGIQKSFPELDLHNIFFSSNYPAEFEAIFDKKIPYADPTVYINITSKETPKDAPEGCENWFVMINVPGDNGQDWDKFIAQAREAIIEKVSRNLKIDIRPLIATESILDPRKIQIKTSSYQGSLYGASSNNRMAAFFRHSNFSKHIKNLYFTGGSVHPGGGIPLCLNSAKIVSNLIGKA